jgi:hypothetical protein
MVQPAKNRMRNNISEPSSHLTIQLDNITPTGPSNGKFFILAIRGLAGGFVHETVNKGGVRVLRCSQSTEEGARCLETPEWIFDRAACCGMVHGELASREPGGALQAWRRSTGLKH